MIAQKIAELITTFKCKVLDKHDYRNTNKIDYASFGFIRHYKCVHCGKKRKQVFKYSDWR